MKKLLGIVVLGLLLIENANSKTFKGKNGMLNEGISKIQFCKIELPNVFGGACQSHSKYFKNGIEVHEYRGGRLAIFKNVSNPIKGGWDTSIKSIDHWGDGTFHALTKSWTEAEKIIKELEKNISSDVTFNLAQKKQQCEAIGFTPKTEKFADCVLRLVELDMKNQQSNNMIASQNKSDSDKFMSNALINLGQQLMKPNSNIYNSNTRNCSVRKSFGNTSTVTCY